MSLDAARELLRESTVPDALRVLGEDEVGSYAVDEARLLYFAEGATQFLCEELDAALLARTLHVFVELEPAEEDAPIPLGASKLKGLPHLPEGVAWPEGQYFAGQLDCSELAPHGQGVFPDRGWLFFFFNGATDATVLYFDGPRERLRVTPYPDAATLPDSKYYLEDFRDDETRVQPKPGWILYVGGDAYGYDEVMHLVPPELADALTAVLGFGPKSSAADDQLLGRPLWWQGEDERWPDDEHEPSTEVLLFQQEFGEGHVHFWGAPDAVRQGKLDEVWLSYSGT